VVTTAAIGIYSMRHVLSLVLGIVVIAIFILAAIAFSGLL
jgi:hypothetical protein